MKPRHRHHQLTGAQFSVYLLPQISPFWVARPATDVAGFQTGEDSTKNEELVCASTFTYIRVLCVSLYLQPIQLDATVSDSSQLLQLRLQRRLQRWINSSKRQKAQVMKTGYTYHHR